MKRLIFVALMISAALSSFAVVAEEGKAGDISNQTQQATPNPDEFDKQLAKVQENMKVMHEQMEKIQKTQDPAERQKLLQDHWATMQDSMGMMHGMWGSGSMGCCMGGSGMMYGSGNPGAMHGMGNSGMMGWGNMQGCYSKLTPEQIQQHQYMMDQYMGAQMMMMDHMMQHQHWMGMPSAQKK